MKKNSPNPNYNKCKEAKRMTDAVDTSQERNIVGVGNHECKEPSANGKKVSDCRKKTAKDEEQDTQNSPIIDVTGVESELSESGGSDVPGHHEEWEFSSLENSQVSSAGSSSDKDSGHSMEKQSEKKKDFIRKFLNEAEAAFKAGEERLNNLTPSRTKVPILDDVCDDDITEAADLARYLKRKQSVMNPLLLHGKFKPSAITMTKMGSSGQNLLSFSHKQTLSNRNKRQTTNEEGEVSDSVDGTFNFTLSDSETSVQVVQHIKSSDALEVNQKKKKKRKGSLENPTEAGREMQNISKREKAGEKPERENQKRKKKRKKDKRKEKNWKEKKEGNWGGEEEMKNQDKEDRKNETKEVMTEKEKKELKIKRKQRATMDEGDRAVVSLTYQDVSCTLKDPEKSEGKRKKTRKKKFETGDDHDIPVGESKCITAEDKKKTKKKDAEKYVKNKSEKHSDMPEIMVGKLNANNTVLLPGKKKKKKIRDSELFEDVSEILKEPLCEPIGKMKDSSRRKKTEKDENLLLVEDTPVNLESTFGKSGDQVEDPVNKKKKRRREVVEDILQAVEPEYCDVPEKKKNKKKKKEVQHLEIIVGPAEIIEPTNCANYAQEKCKKVKVGTGILGELSDSVKGTEKKRKKPNIQDVNEDVIQVVENVLNAPEASLVDDKYGKKKRKRRKVNVSKCEPLDQSFILFSEEQTSCITSNSKSTSNHTPDIFDDLLEAPRDPEEKAVKKRKKTKYEDESVYGSAQEKQQASFNESRGSNGGSCKKKKKIKLTELEEMPCTETASTRSSQDTKSPASPWHRLSRDSNGSFTGCSAEVCTNSYQGSTQNDALNIDFLGKRVNLRKKDGETDAGRPKKIKKVNVRAESTCEEILNCAQSFDSTRTEDSFSQLNSSCIVANKDALAISSSGKQVIGAQQNNIISKTAIAHEVFSESSSEVEMQVSGRGHLKGLTQTLVPSISSSFEGSSEYETLVPGRGNLKDLTQKLESNWCGSEESTPSQSGAGDLCKNKTITNKVQSKTGMLPTGSLLNRLSTKMYEADSDSSDSESIRVSGRGDLRGLTQKLPSKGLNDAQNGMHSRKSVEKEPRFRSQSISSLDQCDKPVFKKKRTSEFKENIPKNIATKKSDSDECSKKKTVQCTRCKCYFESALLLASHFCYQEPKRRSVSEPYRTEGAPFQCECGKRYARKAYLDHHISATHFGIRPFKCDICLMCFSEKQTLRVHQRVHSKELPFECSICGKCFIVQCNLNRHYKSVHKLVSNFACDICATKNILFYFKKDLEAHLKLVHSKTKITTLKALV